MGNEPQVAGGAGGTAPAACMKPRCPYYPESESGLVCPYFMMANNMGPNGMARANGGFNWAGIASLVLGIVSITMCWFSILLFPALIFIVLTILGITFGVLGLRNGSRAGMGKAAAVAGLVLGIIALVFTLLLLFMRLIWWGYY